MTRQILRVAGTVLAALVVILAFVPAAQAEPFTPRLDLAYKLAVQFWGSEPTGCTSLVMEVVPDAAIPGDGGQATQVQPGAPGGPCTLYIAEVMTAPAQWPMACRTMAHEVGHLEGYEHTTDPASIMNPTAIRVTTPECAAASRLWDRIENIEIAQSGEPAYCRRIIRGQRHCWVATRRRQLHLGRRLRDARDRFWALLRS